MICRECCQDLGDDGDYRARLCAECTYYNLDHERLGDEESE